jgi:hypothetical protein
MYVSLVSLGSEEDDFKFSTGCMLQNPDATSVAKLGSSVPIDGCPYSYLSVSYRIIRINIVFGNRNRDFDHFCLKECARCMQYMDKSLRGF